MMEKDMKEGFVREDGKVFWKNCKKKGEIWLRPEQYQKWCETRRNYRTKRAQEYYERRESVSPMDRPYFGKYDFASNLYFAGISSSGKELWVTKKRIEELRQRSARNRVAYCNRLKQHPKTNLRVGDPHPEDPSLFVIMFIGNKAFFGDKERLEQRRAKLRKNGTLRDIKYKHKRREFMASLGDARIHRGAYSLETGLVFWEYSQNCKERWLPVQEFHVLHEEMKQRRKINRVRKPKKRG